MSVFSAKKTTRVALLRRRESPAALEHKSKRAGECAFRKHACKRASRGHVICAGGLQVWRLVRIIPAFKTNRWACVCAALSLRRPVEKGRPHDAFRCCRVCMRLGWTLQEERPAAFKCRCVRFASTAAAARNFAASRLFSFCPAAGCPRPSEFVSFVWFTFPLLRAAFFTHVRRQTSACFYASTSLYSGGRYTRCRTEALLASLVQALHAGEGCGKSAFSRDTHAGRVMRFTAVVVTLC